MALQLNGAIAKTVAENVIKNWTKNNFAQNWGAQSTWLSCKFLNTHLTHYYCLLCCVLLVEIWLDFIANGNQFMIAT